MVMMNATASVAANARTGNVLAGQLYEFMPKSGLVVVKCTGSAVGLTLDFSVGGAQLTQGAIVPQTNRYPISPDDVMLDFQAGRAARLFADFLNTTAGALTYYIVVVIL